MIRSIVRALCLIALTVSMCSAATGLPRHTFLQSMRPAETVDRFIVRFKPSAPEQRDAVARQRLLDFVGVIQGVRISQLRHLAIGADVIQTGRKLDRASARMLMQRLAADPQVAHVEIDALRQPTSIPDAAYNDAYQWPFFDAAAGIDLPAAWDKAKGSGVVVAVLDTGTTPHSDLSPHYRPGYDFISDPAMARNRDGRDANPADMGDWTLAGECTATNPGANSSWHGTHVAGTIAALTNSADGMSGVAPGATVLPVRVLGKCGGYDSDIADAIVWAAGGTVSGAPANAYPAEVINLSFGSPGACDPNSALQAAITTAVGRGSVVVAAAGNDKADVAGFSPASCSNVITVGAVGRSGARASYSNHGARVDVSAPGGDGSDFVYSTYNAGTTGPGAQSYAGLQGTSMAAPQVSGIVALMQSLQVNSPARVKALLTNSARPFPKPCSGCGSGIVDAAAALKAVKGLSPATLPTLSINNISVTEATSGKTTATFTVSLSQASTTPVTYNLQTGTGGTAKAGVDYVAVASTAQTIAAGQTSKTFPVTIIGNTTVEPSKTFQLVASSVVGATVANGVGVGTILNTNKPILSIASASVVKGTSGTTSMTFKATLSQTPIAAVTFHVATADGTAKAGKDYVALPLTALTIATGQTSLTFNVTVDGNTTYGPNETFLVNITGVTGATLANTQATGTIVNDNPMPTLSVNDVAVTEGAAGTTTPATFTISMSSPSTSNVTFDVSTANGTAIAGTDYDAVPVTLVTIPAGSTSATFPVTVIGNNTVELAKTFTLNLSKPTGATVANAQGTGTINNNNKPTLSVANASVVKGTSGTTSMTFKASLSQTPIAAVTFHVATADGTAKAGEDYVALPLTALTIPAGQTSLTFNVTVNGNTTYGPNETFLVNITGVTGATLANTQATGTIVNDNPMPTLSVNDVAVTEGAAGTTTPATFTISMSSPSTSNVTFDVSTANGTAIAGTDYNAVPVTLVTIPAGSTSATFPVTVIGNNTVELAKTFTLNLSNPTGATVANAQGTGTVNNNNLPAMSISDASVTVGSSGTSMTFTITLSQPPVSAVTYNVATSDGTAYAGTNYAATTGSGTFYPGTTSATFSVPVYGDTTIQPNKTFFANLSSVVGATVARAQGAGTIIDSIVPTVYVSNLPYTVVKSSVTSENLIDVKLSLAAPYPVTVLVGATPGSAHTPQDYTFTQQNVTIQPGQTEVGVWFDVVGNNICELNIYGQPDLTFSMGPVSSITPGVLIGPSGSITIQEPCNN